MALQYLVLNLKVDMTVTDGTISNFKTGTLTSLINNAFQSGFGGDIVIPAGTVDQQVSLEGVVHAQVIFFIADQALKIKLVPQGGTVLTTLPMTIYPNLPSVVCLQDIEGIYISNPGVVDSKFIVEGVGINT